MVYISSARNVKHDVLAAKLPITTPVSKQVGEMMVRATSEKRCPKCDVYGCYCVYSYHTPIFLLCEHCGYQVNETTFYSKTTRLLQDQLAIAYPLTYGVALAVERAEEAQARKDARKQARKRA